MSLSRLIPPSRPARAVDEHWIPLSDLMTGLMMLFMLIAISFMVQVEAQSARIKKVAVVYDDMREGLYTDLLTEFRDDLPRWKAELDRDLTIRFQEPEVLFDTGKALLKPAFNMILDDFFPRYVTILSSAKYRDSIEEIRIEGHTSTLWSEKTPPDEAYFKNMELSQTRTRSTLQHVLLLPALNEQKGWLTSRLTANGLSSSRTRLNADGSENPEASQRVEFRVRTNAEARLGEILKATQR